MRLDLLMIIIGLLLIIAMALTLIFGKEYSRHGYGAIVPDIQKQPVKLFVFS